MRAAKSAALGTNVTDEGGKGARDARGPRGALKSVDYVLKSVGGKHVENLQRFR
jgi:hypothetical protein